MGPSVRPLPATPLAGLARVVVALLVGVSASVTAFSAPAGGAPPVAGRAAATTPAPTRVRVVDHNIAKQQSALAQALEVARRTAAEIITLQEVCWWQADDVVAAHPEWSIAWKPERANPECVPAEPRSGEDAERSEVGNLAVWTGGPGATTSSPTFRPQRYPADRAGLACLTWRDTVLRHACSVHLISPTAPDQVKIRTAQARDIRRITGPWLAADDLVVLGGDFNAEPGRQTMKNLYALDGRGSFREVSSRRLSRRDCRCVRSTYDGRDSKIDYIFYSANRTAPRARMRLRLEGTASDHRLLVGSADMNTSRR